MFIGAPALQHPRAIAIQFRYGFIVDDEGLKVINVTVPEDAHVVAGALVSLGDTHDVYVARTYAYVANGREGIAIIDVEQPEKPRLDQNFNAGGKLNDTHQVKVAMTNASLFAYVADGHNGLRVLQLTSPETMPNYAGFSPRPEPKLIATFKTKGEALAISKALDRDRAVDEGGNQIAVFGRRGARPFNLDEIMRMLRTENGNGEFFTVTDQAGTKPREPGKVSGGTDQPQNASPDSGSISEMRLIQQASITMVLAGGFGLLLLAARRRFLLRRSDSSRGQ